MGRERARERGGSWAVRRLYFPVAKLVSSAGIQCSFKKGPALPDALIASPLYCMCALSMWVQCGVSKGWKDLKLFVVKEVTWGRPCLCKTNINCATSSENNGGQDTECVLIHISIVYPPLLLLLWAWSIRGVKGGGEERRRGSSSGGSGGLAVFFLLCLCANAQTVQ